MRTDTYRKPWILAAAAWLGCVALAGCGKGAAEATPTPASPSAAAEPAPPGGNLHDMGEPGDAAKGEAVYGRVCVACHQADGTGNGGMLAANFKTDTSRLAKPDSELFKSINEGLQGKVGVMPAQKGSLTEQEIKDVIAFVRSKFGDG